MWQEICAYRLTSGPGDRQMSMQTGSDVTRTTADDLDCRNHSIRH